MRHGRSMRTDFYSSGPIIPSAKQTLRVSDDLPADLPVTDAELDVFEAFLGARLRAILADAPCEKPPRAAQDCDLGQEIDSKTCHSVRRSRRTDPES